MSEPDRIALMLGGDRPQFMEVEDAKHLYAALESKRLAGAQFTDDDKSLHAALTLSLGTMFDLERVRRDWEEAGNKWEGPI